MFRPEFSGILGLGVMQRWRLLQQPAVYQEAKPRKSVPAACAYISSSSKHTNGLTVCVGSL